MGSFSYAVDWEEEAYGGEAGWKAPGDEGMAMEEGRGQGAKMFNVASAGSAAHSDIGDQDARRRMS